jgi:hypothetical protein
MHKRYYRLSFFVPADKTVEASNVLTPVNEIATEWATATDIFPVTITNNAPSVFLPGKTIVTWTATDTSGNIATATQLVTVTYAFGGIRPPVKGDGSSVFKAGSTVPVKFRLTDYYGNYISDSIARISYAKISGDVIGDDVEAVSTSAATTGNLFRYDASDDQYIFNLSTKGLSSGTYLLKITLNDGTTHTVQIGLK